MRMLEMNSATDAIELNLSTKSMSREGNYIVECLLYSSRNRIRIQI